MDTITAQTLWLVMEALHDEDQMESALAGALDILKKAVGCEEGTIWMYDEQSDSLIAVISSGPDDHTGTAIRIGEGIVGQTMQKGVPAVYSGLRNASSDTSAGDASAQSSADAQSSKVNIAGDDWSGNPDNLMCIPLRTPVHTIGCVMLTDKQTGFTEADRKLCENCCAVIALDIEDKGFAVKPFEDRKPIVSLRNVVKEFMNGEEIRRILKGVDLDVYEGELMVVLGESGCGKSTMLNIIGGMDTMTSGQLLIEGKDFSNPTEAELTQYRREYIGFIFQAYNLMPNLSALENIEFIAEIADKPLNSMEALNMVGLEEKADNLPSALSGGQMQRVSIARALVKDPKIILADEPTAALDYETSIMVLEVIERIVKERKTTVLMVTHNPEIAKMANRVIKLRNGKVSGIRINLHPHKATDLVW